MTQQNPNLPDFKPRGMARTDKNLAWLMAFIVLVFVMVQAVHYLPSVHPSAKPTPAATATAHPSPTASAKASKTSCKS